MKYIIMADGKMTRWKIDCDTPKHLIKIQGETLIERLVRQLKEVINVDDKIIITSHDSRYEVVGATRYEPKNNHIELDRFTWELIEDEVCFLYGDTYYSDYAINQIVKLRTNDLDFVSTKDSIIAVIVNQGDELKKHIEIVKEHFYKGIIPACKGWQVYQSYTNQLRKNKFETTESMVHIEDETFGFNTVHDYCKFKEKLNISIDKCEGGIGNCLNF